MPADLLPGDEGGRELGTTHSPLRVLLVDDDERERSTVRRCLEHSGLHLTVDEAGSADEALERLGSSPYGCVLLDFYLPDTDGSPLLQSIRESAPELPVVMLTGRGYEEFPVALMQPGATDYVPKGSLSPDRLELCLRATRELARIAAARRQVEDELRLQEERFRRAFEIETVGIIFFTTDGKITGANDAFLRMSGYTREDLEAGRIRWDELTPLEWMPASLRAVAEFQAMGRTTPYEKEYYHKDGGRWWALFAATRLNDREGVEFVIDISEQKRSEALATEQKKLLEGVVRGRPLEAILTDLALLIEHHSSALCSILLLDGEGRLRHGAAPSLPEAYTAAIDGAPIGPRAGSCGTAAYRGEPVVVTDIDRDELWTEYRGLALPHGLRACWSHPITNGSGKVLGTVAMYYRTRREPSRGDWELTQTAASIAAIVIERAEAERERQQLHEAERQARLQAERAVYMRDEVLGIVAHDLRTPLGTILNVASLLAQPVPEERRGRYAAMVERAARTAHRLIDDLLLVTHIESGTFSLSPEPFQVRALLDEVLEAFEMQRGEVALDAVVAPGVPTLHADHGRLLQVLSNLVGNALKFTAAGGRVSLHASREGDAVHFSVEDTGSGIPAEDLPHVFDRFWQAHRGSRSGAGLGLAICRGIVETHGGCIWVESTPGSGTTFHFTVPLRATGSSGGGDQAPDLPAVPV